MRAGDIHVTFWTRQAAHGSHSRVGGSGAVSPDSCARAARPGTGAVIAGAGRGAGAVYFHLVDEWDHVAREGVLWGV